MTAKRYAQELADEFERVELILNIHENNEAVWQQHNSGDGQMFTSTAAIPLSDDQSVLYLDLQSSSVIPFPFERVSTAAWTATRAILAQNDGSNCIHEDNSQVLAKVEGGVGTFTYTTLVAIRRFVEKTRKRMVIVCRSSCDDADQSEHLVTDETSWCVFEPTLDNCTLVRTCVHAIPVPRDVGLASNGIALQNLTQTLASEITKELASLKLMIEDLLVDEEVQYDKKRLETS